MREQRRPHSDLRALYILFYSKYLSLKVDLQGEAVCDEKPAERSEAHLNVARKRKGKSAKIQTFAVKVVKVMV